MHVTRPCGGVRTGGDLRWEFVEDLTEMTGAFATTGELGSVVVLIEGEEGDLTMGTTERKDEYTRTKPSVHLASVYLEISPWSCVVVSMLISLTPLLRSHSRFLWI